MRIRTLILFVLLLTCAGDAAANSGRLYPSDQLTSGLITCICQDKYGYIWIGTEYGLNKFDGYRFTPYLHSSNDSTSITDNEIASLYVDAKGTLWVGGAQGLASYDYDTNSFRRYRFPDNNQPRITSLVEDAQGKLYIGTAGYGLYSLTQGNDYVDYESAYNEQIPEGYFERVFFDRKNNLWRSSHDDEMTYFTVGNGHPIANKTYISPYDLPVTYLNYADDALLIICKKGILRFDYQTGLLTDAGFDLSILEGNISFSNAYLDKDGDLYIGTTGNGLMVIRRSDKRLTRVENTNQDIDLRLTNVSAFAEDRSGNIWIGCYKKGLLTVSKDQESFESWTFSRQNLRTGGSIASIVSADDGGVWCTVKPGGVYKMDATGQITAHPLSPPNNVLYRDRQGRYWLGTDKTLCRYQPEQGTWKVVKTFEGRGINYILGDDKGRLYISVFGAGLCILNPDTGEETMMEMKQAGRPEGYLCNNWIYTMTFDHEGNLWLATASGIAMMKPEGMVFNSMGWNHLLGNKPCYSICQTAPEGDILIGTNSGLYVFRPKTNKAELLEGVEPLQDKFICAMIPDPQTTTIWIATTKGIWEYDHKSGNVVPHINGNGLTSQEYTLGVGMYADGKIYFGTNDGITVFSPQQVQKKQRQVTGNVKLTGITVNGRPLNPMQNEFGLSYRENTLTLEFSLLDFRNPENISYEWRINGTKHWQQTAEGENRITFSELQPGSYDIEVRAINNGIVSQQPHLLRIVIHKPWYRSGWAWLVYFLVAGGFIGLILYNYERQRRRDLEETKMRFLINATHDIRSPLTLIMGPLEKLKAESGPNPYIDIIDRNARRLLLLVNQILDERKIDKGQMKLSCQETDLNKFVGGIAKLYEYHAQQRNIDYRFEHPETPVMAWIDHVNFDKVVSNLLSNALKYTFDGGSIVLRLTQDQHRATLEVIDSGIGFEDDRTERFFERFYQGRNSKDLHIDGTGIGLNLSRSITEMHGGTITARNRKDGQRGAILTVSLPLGNKHLKPEEIENGQPEPRKSGQGDKRKPTSSLHILLVDDDQEIADYISHELSTWYRFDYAENGRQALKRLLAAEGNTYDLVISDIMMPEMDGISLLRSIKQNPAISHMPVILLTSKSEVSYRLEGLKKGADAYLAKPFNMEELHILIDNLVDNVRRLRGKFTGAASQEGNTAKVEVRSNNDLLMERIMKVINSHLADSELNVDMLTKEAGISRAQLHRKMKEITGLSTSEFIRNLRLEQAARLIREKKINISQVTYAVGFNNQSHFSTVFKKYFGVSPTEYALTSATEDELHHASE